MIKRLTQWFCQRRFDRAAVGKWGEEQAERYLRQLGWTILGRRVQMGARWELDLVAREDERTLVFVEVRTRKNEDFGSPESSLRRRKRRALSRAARAYLKTLKKPPDYVRFDVVEVIGQPGGQPEIRHLPGAVSIARGKPLLE